MPRWFIFQEDVFIIAHTVFTMSKSITVKSPDLITQEIQELKTNYDIQAILLKDEIALNPNKKIFILKWKQSEMKI